MQNVPMLLLTLPLRPTLFTLEWCETHLVDDPTWLEQDEHRSWLVVNSTRAMPQYHLSSKTRVDSFR